MAVATNAITDFGRTKDNVRWLNLIFFDPALRVDNAIKVDKGNA